MRSPPISVCGFLWVWLPLFYTRSVKIDKVIADTKSLTKTIVARIQEHQVSGGMGGGNQEGGEQEGGSWLGRCWERSVAS